jgi:3',5'-cyclic AMP phosphodiesterase CpdA
MLIAQISDIHVGFDSATPQDENIRRLDRVLAQLAAMPARADHLLLTGDLVEHGDEASYRLLADRLAGCPIPAHLIPGNHDSRAAFRTVFPDAADAGGFVQFVIEDPALRIILLDTLEDGRHGGGFCEVRARWLADRLAETPAQPALIALHHPPIDSGIEWMTTDPAEPWVARLRAAIAGHDTIVALICGHLHRQVVGVLDKVPVLVAPSTAAPLALRLEPIDADHPDGRPLVMEGPPGFALHLWQGGRLVTHFGVADDAPAIVRFDARMQPVVRHMIGERP